MIGNRSKSERKHIDSLRDTLVEQKIKIDRLVTAPEKIHPDYVSISDVTDVKNDIIKHMAKHGLNLQKKFSDAYDLVSETSKDNWDGAINTSCAKIIREFSAILDAMPSEFKSIVVNKSMQRTVQYYLKIEIANARYFRRKGSDLDIALKIYRELYSENDSDPIVSYRYARAKSTEAAQKEAFLRENKQREVLSSDGRKVGEFVNYYAEILKILGDFEAKIKSDTETGSCHWLYLASFVFSGYLYYKMANFIFRDIKAKFTQKPIKNVAPLFESVFRKLRSAVSCGIQLQDKISALKENSAEKVTYTTMHKLLHHKSISNTIYYLSISIELRKFMINNKISIENQELNIFLDSLEDSVVTNIYLLENFGAIEYPEKFRSSHSLMKGYRAIGRNEQAFNIATIVRNEILDAVSRRSGVGDIRYQSVWEHLVDNEKECYADAVEIIVDGSKKPDDEN